ncbi:MAG: M23 family metallopeptidase [Oligoflexia bacterium]|nr:M23 family metallopeptidase [Oligoflexia bacterium]
MDNKFVTIMVVPDRKEKVRKWVVSASHLKVFAVGFGLVTILLAAIVVDYVSLLSQSIENKKLIAENSALRSQFKVLDGKLTSVESALDRIKTFATKLRLITAVNDPDRGLNLAMGPLSRQKDSVDELDLPDTDRAPASTMVDEPVFKPKSLTEITRGELAEESDRDYAKLSVRLDRASRVSQLREQGVLELWEQLQDRSALLSATPSTRPVQGGWFTSRFGYRLSPYTDKPVMHEGLDIAAAPGTPVIATADGTITFAGYDPGYGKLVIIDHGYGVESRYGHNSQITVAYGQKVRHGDVIGAVGNTGRSTGPHCHYEVRVNGQPIDPINYILDE